MDRAKWKHKWISMIELTVCSWTMIWLKIVTFWLLLCCGWWLIKSSINFNFPCLHFQNGETQAYCARRWLLGSLLNPQSNNEMGLEEFVGIDWVTAQTLGKIYPAPSGDCHWVAAVILSHFGHAAAQIIMFSSNYDKVDKISNHFKNEKYYWDLSG